MKSPPHFLIACLVISACLIGSQVYAQQAARVPPGTNSWQVAEEASLELTKKLRVVPSFGDFLAKCTGVIVQKPVKWKGSPLGTFIVARFKLHEDGTVSAIELSGSSNTPAAPSIIKNIKSCSPFPRWPNGMRSAAVKQYLEIYVHYGLSRGPEPGLSMNTCQAPRSPKSSAGHSLSVMPRCTV
jgi:hypothetical protein